MPAHRRRHIQQQKDPEYPAYDYLYYDYYDVEADNSNRRRKTTDSFSDVKMNAILERALEKVRSAKRRISEAVKATSSSAEEEQEE